MNLVHESSWMLIGRLEPSDDLPSILLDGELASAKLLPFGPMIELELLAAQVDFGLDCSLGGLSRVLLILTQ